MKKLSRSNIKILTMIIIFFLNSISFSEIPTIVISPSKTPQSLSSVGGDLTQLNTQSILNANENFIGDIFDTEISGINFSRQGGEGTNSLIQLRGLPKRYTNIYIDGIKQSDPSTPDNAYYLNNLTVGSIQSVEILKGSQSSVYGSGAIGGVVNINSRDGKEKNNKFFQLNSGSNNKKNAILTYGNNYENYNYSLTVEKYITDGISSMSDNNEKDPYRNDNIHLAFGYNFLDNLKIETNFKYSDTILEFDEVNNTRPDKNSSDDEELSSSIRIINENNNYKNSLIFGHYFVKRKVSDYNMSNPEYYYGERKNINYIGEYNFNLDKKIIFGLDNEFNRANFTTWAVSGNKISDDIVLSQYFDIQQRHSQKFHTTFGLRNDIHSKAGSSQTGRITGAYNVNGTSKLRGSIGTGIRFGSLNDYYYDENILNKEDLKPEKSYGVDLGIDKNYEKINTNFNLTFFYTEYDNNISNWASNTDNGRSSFVIDNSEGKIRSQGFDLKILNNSFKNYESKLLYTFTKAYDGEDCDDPDKMVTSCSQSSYPVRVPRHQISSSFKKSFDSKISSQIVFKYISTRRDYGNSNNGFNDVMLDDYIKVDLKNNFNFFGKNFYFNINNLFNEKYEDAYQYNSEKRRFNFGLSHKF